MAYGAIRIMIDHKEEVIMAEEYRTVYTGGEGEVVEKKSRFIATVVPVRSEEEALQAIEQLRKKYWDARHNCFAYVIGERGELERFSDDGEPGGTAGKPILEVLKGEELRNTLIVVTRYFGGTLLGTGGLVRAYTQSAQAGIAASTLITKIDGYELKIETDYSGLGKLQYLLAQRGLPTVDADYAETVTLSTLVAAGEEKAFIKAVTEATNAQAAVRRERACRFAYQEGEAVIF